MNGVQLRRKVARLKAERQKSLDRLWTYSVVESISRTTPKFRGFASPGARHFFSVMCSILSITVLSATVLKVVNSWIGAAP